MSPKRIDRIILGVSTILLGIALSVALSQTSWLGPLYGFPFALIGWLIANQKIR